MLDKYEELNLTTYVDSNPDQLVLADIRNNEIKQRSDAMVDSMKNPFEELYHWCKWEIYELQSL